MKAVLSDISRASSYRDFMAGELCWPARLNLGRANDEQPDAKSSAASCAKMMPWILAGKMVDKSKN